MSDPTLQQHNLYAAPSCGGAGSPEAALQAQLAAATAFTYAKRDSLAAAERAL